MKKITLNNQEVIVESFIRENDIGVSVTLHKANEIYITEEEVSGELIATFNSWFNIRDRYVILAKYYANEFKLYRNEDNLIVQVIGLNETRQPRFELEKETSADIELIEKPHGYKSCTKENLGVTDVATLIALTEDKADIIELGIDGDINAYMANEYTEIPSHYTHTKTYTDEVSFLDAELNSLTIKADEIKVYRCGNAGLIIQSIGLKGMTKYDYRYLQ